MPRHRVEDLTEAADLKRRAGSDGLRRDAMVERHEGLCLLHRSRGATTHRYGDEIDSFERHRLDEKLVQRVDEERSEEGEHPDLRQDGRVMDADRNMCMPWVSAWEAGITQGRA